MPKIYIRHKVFTPPNKIIWTEAQLNFMTMNFDVMTNQAMADALGLKLTSVRTKLYELGLYKMRLEYWTDEQIEFLKANYETLGDTELAEIFSQTWAKEKGWSKKHIEKKRRYLKLKRSTEQKKAVHARNVAAGAYSMCAINAWKTRGVSPVGTIRFWRTSGSDRMVPFIKLAEGYVHWSRWFWEKTNGPIEEGMFVSFVGDTSNLTIENLKLVTALEHRQNVCSYAHNLADGYIAGIITHNSPELRSLVRKNPELISAKRTLLLLNRKIKSHGQKQTNRSK